MSTFAADFWQYSIPAFALTVCIVGAANKACQMWRDRKETNSVRVIAQRYKRKALESRNSSRA